ncbi:Trihelix transcription factor ASIL2 [Striga hermonthica]|uniref:Trihelix transcription factor ASIL2 n=1 Tax=Striga hermonthica TaxID=68872 RepID=A0A9N7N9J3_STRHE|nr:Trihelix transcription factor ASIL2 [Striga hermonthica]
MNIINTKPHQKATPSSAAAGVGGREDFWSEGATAVLIDAWGERYLELSRGNLKQKHWKDVADIVAAREDYTKPPKTDVQCKNRIDTVKKKYKAEKAKIAAGGGPSKWRFYHKLDELVGPTSKLNSSSAPPSIDAASNHSNHNTMQQKAPMGIPVGLRSSSAPGHKRPPFNSDDESEPDHSADSSDGLPPATNNKRPRFQRMPNNNANASRNVVMMNKKSDAGNKWGNSMKELTQAILKFGEAYEVAETAKLQQLVEMEKQRMKFAKDLELQRMQNFMKTQLELSQLKVRKPGTNNKNHHGIINSNDGKNNNNNSNNNASNRSS